MKTIYKLSFLFLALAWTACKKDKTPDEPDPAEEWGITIVDGMIQSPEWLVHKIDSIGDLYLPTPVGGKCYPAVWGVEYNGQKFLLLWDQVNSNFIRGTLYFTLSGNPVTYGTNLYGELEGARRENAIHLWPILKKSVSTRSEDREIFSVFTPNGTRVPDTYEYYERYNTSSEKLYALGEMLSQYPRASTTENDYAVILSDPSTTYNCHAYAWHMEEGGSRVWMNWGENATNVYIEDGSYIEVSSDVHDAKVWYLSDDHSAIAITHVVFRSKWGAWPEMRHDKNYGPYDASDLKYYKRATDFSINGVDQLDLGSSASFSVTDPPLQLTWDSSPNLSLTGSGNPVTVTANGGGPGWVRILADTLEVARKSVEIIVPPPPPRPAITGPNYAVTGEQVTYTMAGAPHNSNCQYVWNSTNAVISTQSGNTITLSFTTIGTHTISGYYIDSSNPTPSLPTYYAVDVSAGPLVPIDIRWTVVGYTGWSDNDVFIIDESNSTVYHSLYATGGYCNSYDMDPVLGVYIGKMFDYSFVSDSEYAQRVQHSGERTPYQLVMTNSSLTYSAMNGGSYSIYGKHYYFRQPKLPPGKYRVVFIANNFDSWYFEDFEVTPAGGVEYPAGQPAIHVLYDRTVPYADDMTKMWLSTKGYYTEWSGTYYAEDAPGMYGNRYVWPDWDNRDNAVEWKASRDNEYWYSVRRLKLQKQELLKEAVLITL